MRKLFFLLLTAALTCLGASAVTVRNTAGQLSQLVQDTQITQLTVTGTMDARDFLFITNELTELTSINLSQVSIVPVSSGQVLYGTVTSYVANEIPRTAFFGKKLTSVVLPENTQAIGFAAFAGCYQLHSVTLPASVTFIDDYAFAGTALTSVEIPSTVLYMGKGVYSRCEQLQSANVNGANVGDYAFLGATRLSSVQLGNMVKSIGKGAFNGCTALTTINIDPTCRMTRIDDEAFINSGLENINIKNLGLGSIGDWAFAQTQLRNIDLTDGLKRIGEGALAHNRLLEDVALPGLASGDSSQPTNGGNGFQPYVGPRLAGLHPNLTLENISNYTFAGDTLLHADNMLSRGVATIGDYAFYNVSQDMDTMYLPATVAYLGNYAMAGMTGMKTLKTDAKDVPAVGENVWAGVNQPSVPLIAPSSESTALYRAADQWMNFFFQEDDVLLGDVNNDGAVNIADVTTLIDYLLGSNVEINLRNADCNSDGGINIADVTTLIDSLLSGSKGMLLHRISAMLANQYPSTSDHLTMSDVAMRAGETRTVDVTLNSSENDYIAMQCEVVLPQGMKLIAAESVNGDNHDSYSIQHDVETNVYTLINVSMTLNRYENEGTVVRLTVAADETFDGLSAELKLANVMLITPQHAIFIAGDATTTVNDCSGINQITAQKEVASVRYINVAGLESDTPFDGINVVVTTYTDGSTSTSKVIK